MIIWQRWGILAILFVGAGVGLGFLLKALFGVRENSGAPVGVFIGVGFVLAAAGLWAFDRFVLDRHLDKARPAYILEPLPEPVVNAQGVRQTHRQVPVVHPETGQQIFTQPRSSLFFIPFRFLPFVLGALGLVIFVVNLVVLLAGPRA